MNLNVCLCFLMQIQLCCFLPLLDFLFHLKVRKSFWQELGLCFSCNLRFSFQRCSKLSLWSSNELKLAEAHHMQLQIAFLYFLLFSTWRFHFEKMQSSMASNPTTSYVFGFLAHKWNSSGHIPQRISQANFTQRNLRNVHFHLYALYEVQGW